MTILTAPDVHEVAPEQPDTYTPLVLATGAGELTGTPETPEQFYSVFGTAHDSAVRGVVSKINGEPKLHRWPSRMESAIARLMAEYTRDADVYHTMALYPRDKVGRFEGRSKANAAYMTGIVVDVDAGPEKFKRNPEKNYPDEAAALEVTKRAVEATGLVPSYVARSPSGGLHLYYLTGDPMRPAQWEPYAKAVQSALQAAGLLIDTSCTTDAARIMRMPGSLYKSTGKRVGLYRYREALYTWDELGKLAGFDPQVSAAPITAASSGLVSAPDYLQGKAEAVNSEVVTYKPFSAARVAEQCGAFAKASARGGEDTPYPVWLLALVTAKASKEGRPFAHAISCRHPDYDEVVTDAKLDSLTGGPATCEAWRSAYGADGPCNACAWNGQVASPVGLGIIEDAAPVGERAEHESAALPDEIAELNARFALVRFGGKVVVADMAAPKVGEAGAYTGLELIEVGAFKSMLRGRMAPLVAPGAKVMQLADWWERHEGRRQYQGCAFAPGEDVGPAVFNLWRGFAVTPGDGDVKPWLDVLAAVVPDAALRAYVLSWLAWKIQHPGGVPGTLLILRGAKGAGKNALLAPLLAVWGAHGMLVADPELIAGRFTAHLMDKAFVVLDEAVFVGDPRQADRIKARVTGGDMAYERKGCDPVHGVNRAAYVMLTNHAHVWEATADERRAVIVDVGEGLRGRHDVWGAYFQWVKAGGAAALLAYLQGVDLTDFNPRKLPKNDALQAQIAMTALRDPVVAFWATVLGEGALPMRHGGRFALSDAGETEVPSHVLREAFEDAVKGKRCEPWPQAVKKLKALCGEDIGPIQRRNGTERVRVYSLPALVDLQCAFTTATGVPFSAAESGADGGDEAAEFVTQRTPSVVCHPVPSCDRTAIH